MNKLTVRALTPKDVPFVARTEHEVFSDAWSENAILSHLDAQGAIAAVIAENDTPIGYLLGLCLTLPEGMPAEGELYRIAVLPKERKKGIGRFVLLRFLDILDKMGADVCFLEVRESNTAARAL